MVELLIVLFANLSFILICFFKLTTTTKAKRIWRFAGVFTVALRQRECGSKTAGMHVSQPMNIGVCYGFVASCFPVVFLFSCINVESPFVSLYSQTVKVFLNVFFECINVLNLYCYLSYLTVFKFNV